MSSISKLSTILFMISLLFTECAKRINQNCRIVASTLSPFADTTRIFYDKQGKVQRIKNNISVTEYTYSKNQLTLIRKDTGTFIAKTVIDLNSRGLATNVRVYFDQTDTSWVNTAYEYDGEEVRKETFTSSVGGREDITTYIWVNHNIVSSTSNAATTNWQYYSPFQYKRQMGDYLSYQELINGYAVYRTRDLLMIGDKVKFINYDFNSNTNISAVSFTVGNANYTLKYEYECN